MYEFEETELRRECCGIHPSSSGKGRRELVLDEEVGRVPSEKWRGGGASYPNCGGSAPRNCWDMPDRGRDGELRLWLADGG